MLNCVLPLCLLAGAAAALVLRLRVLAGGRAALPEAVWRVLALCPACCACSPTAAGTGALYNSVAQDDDTIAMDSLSFGDGDFPSDVPASASAAPGASVAPAQTAESTVAATGATEGATAADAANAAKMTSPFTMAFDDMDDEDDDSAWKTF